MVEQQMRSLNRQYELEKAQYAQLAAKHQAALVAEGQHAETHKGVVMLVGLLLVKPGKFEPRFGRMLANLKDAREASDYDVLSFTDREAAGRGRSPRRSGSAPRSAST